MRFTRSAVVLRRGRRLRPQMDLWRDCVDSWAPGDLLRATTMQQPSYGATLAPICRERLGRPPPGDVARGALPPGGVDKTCAAQVNRFAPGHRLGAALGRLRADAEISAQPATSTLLPLIAVAHHEVIIVQMRIRPPHTLDLVRLARAERLLRIETPHAV